MLAKAAVKSSIQATQVKAVPLAITDRSVLRTKRSSAPQNFETNQFVSYEVQIANLRPLPYGESMGFTNVFLPQVLFFLQVAPSNRSSTTLRILIAMRIAYLRVAIYSVIVQPLPSSTPPAPPLIHGSIWQRERGAGAE